MLKEFEWSRIYRPLTVADTILPPSVKKIFQNFVDQKNLPNMTIVGPPGIGKTTIAIAALTEIDCDYMLVRASVDKGIDILREDMRQFAGTVSFKGGRKYIILDEADGMSPALMQGLRNFIDEFSINCGFILTGNSKEKFKEAVTSRCPIVEFTIRKEDKPRLLAEFIKRLEMILTTEKVKYNIDVLIEVVNKNYPDFRRTLNELQKYAAQTDNSIDSGMLSMYENKQIKELIAFMRAKDYTNSRKWVAENRDMDFDQFVRAFYDGANKYFTKSTIPIVIMILAKFQYQMAFVNDPEVTIAACVAEIMLEAQFTS